jgi:asparagine synthase (glutamine-hydrolysing)
MSGIAGIIVFKPFDDVENIVRHMSNAIQHRGIESLHKFVRLTNSEQYALISVRAQKHNAVKIDSRPTHLHIVGFSSHSGRDFENEVHWSIDTFNTVAVKVGSDGLSVFRSVDGTCGFYYTKIEGAVIFASEKKSIWAICKDNVESLEPGHILSVAWDGKIAFTELSGLARPLVNRSIDRYAAIQSLERSLIDSFRYLGEAHRCAVLFSGGVDSALASLLTKLYCEDTLLITASCEDCHDEAAAIRAAELMDSRSIMYRIDSDALWDALPEVIYSIETSQRMHVEIALPFFFAAREAKRRGVHLLVSGQGPDELFAGYARHEKLMKEQGFEAVEESLWNEVSVTHEMNIQRDVRAIAVHGLDVFFPYMFPPFIREAMSLPATLKVDPCGVPSRKIIFRELAEHLGLPNEITRAPKRATQYSSGTSKLLFTTVLGRVGGVEKCGRKEKNLIIQRVLDTIAMHLQMPVARKGTIEKIDLESTERLMKRLEISTSSD